MSCQLAQPYSALVMKPANGSVPTVLKQDKLRKSNLDSPLFVSPLLGCGRNNTCSHSCGWDMAEQTLACALNDGFSHLLCCILIGCRDQVSGEVLPLSLCTLPLLLQSVSSAIFGHRLSILSKGNECSAGSEWP